jgi:hypothetical protein
MLLKPKFINIYKGLNYDIYIYDRVYSKSESRYHVLQYQLLKKQGIILPDIESDDKFCEYYHC